MLEQRDYKNYKELCKAMNWSITGGDTKVKHLKELDSLCKWHKEGNKIVIDEIYSEPKEIIDNRYATIDKLPYFVVKDMEELNNREQYYIDLYSKDNNYIVINKRRAFKEKHETKNIKVSNQKS